MRNDYEEIRALICSYPDLIDRGDFDGIARLFARARIVSGDGQVYERRETLRKLWSSGVATYEGGSPCTRHLVTNVVVRIEDDERTASASSCVAVFQGRADFPLQVIAISRHQDRFEKLEGDWWFVERRDQQDLVGDLSHHYPSGGGE